MESTSPSLAGEQKLGLYCVLVRWQASAAVWWHASNELNFSNGTLMVTYGGIEAYDYIHIRHILYYSILISLNGSDMSVFLLILNCLCSRQKVPFLLRPPRQEFSCFWRCHCSPYRDVGGRNMSGNMAHVVQGFVAWGLEVNWYYIMIIWAIWCALLNMCGIEIEPIFRGVLLSTKGIYLVACF